MFGLEIILGIIFEKIIEPVIQPVGRHAGFLLHYKRNLNNLEVEVNNLQEQRSDVEGKVNEAKHQGEAIENKVSVWLDDADKTSQEVEQLRNEKTVKENMLCCSFSCPNFISRYRLSKEAERKVVRVKHLTEKGGNIGTVSHPREDPPEVVFRSGGNYESFHSRDKVFEDIVKALKDPEVNMIGVYGTGGVGKTTMVTNVAEQVKKDGTFDEVVIAVASQDANVIKIQGQLAARLKLPLSGETDDEVGRASRLWNRLNNGMKNLIILDDVWHGLDLKEIGIPISDGNKSCKVVLTARNRDVWKNMDVQHKDFKIEILIGEESWALFQKKVGNYVDADQELREIAWAVCKECQGLPVAINAVGAALKDKDMYAWRDALDKQRNSMPNEIVGIDRRVYACLKWSYDRLDSEDAKSCFLLCCLFPEDAKIPIDNLVRYYMAGKNIRRDQKPDTLEIAFNRVRTVVGTLRSCCLLLDENYYEDFVTMHDVLRDIAISIAKDEKSFLVKHGVSHWPEKATYDHCSVISLKPNDMLEFPDQLVCPELHTLRLDCTENKFRDQFPERFFDGMENLMVLDLNRVTMSPILPASLAKLSKLQMLCLERCKLGDIAILKDLKHHLEILSLRRSDIEVLPPEVGELTCLRVFDMKDCHKLKVIPKGVIAKLRRLEELYMPWEFSQWEETRADGTGRDISCVSLDELMSLTRLTTLLHVRIGDPALLPEDFTFENLVRFDIAVGENASYSIYHKDSTGVLQLEKIRVANGLESLLGKPKPKGSIQRNGLYPSTSFYHLTDLSVTDCRLKYLFSPSSARGLVQLKKLAIKRCMDMEGVIGNEDIIPISFSRLNELSLKDLPNLKSFYPKKEKKATSSESCSAHDAKTVLFTDKVILPVLKTLFISTVGNIVEIWDKQSIAVLEDKGSFCQLMDVSIEYCDKLLLVFPSKMHPQLKNLETLRVMSCAAMEGIVEFEGEIYEDGLRNEVCFSKLSRLILSRLPNLVRFCTKLRTAGTIDGNATIQAQPLFNEKVIFPVLEILTIAGLDNIIKIWDNQSMVVVEERGSFCQLTKVKVDSCNKLMHVWSFKKHPLLKNLKELEVSFCGTMKSITEFEGEIDEDGLRNENLQKLTIENCDVLEVIFSKELKEKEAINYDIIVFPQLESVTLQNLPKLKSFYTETQGFFSHKVILPVLKRLDISRMGNIIEIWDKQSIAVLEGKGSFCQLTKVSITSCDNLLLVFPSKMHPQLKNLEELEVDGCPAMEGIVEFEGEIYEDGLGNEVCFSKLSRLTLRSLPNLVRFCTKMRTAGTTDGNATIHAQPLFNEKVVFPVLKELSFIKLDKITRIWDNQPLSEPEKEAKSFYQLMDIFVLGCVHLEYVLPFYMLPQLKNLQKLDIWRCTKMEVIISNKPKDQKEATINDTILFPQLKTVELAELPNLKSLCTETQLFFSNKDAFPVLETIELDPEGTLEFLRNEMASTKEVSMEECGTSGKENDHNGEQG